jgi:hypothetical protein
VVHCIARSSQGSKFKLIMSFLVYCGGGLQHSGPRAILRSCWWPLY